MAAELHEGARVAGRYAIRRLIGRGGMGAVYEAQHEELGRLVALKVLLPKFAEDAEMLARFFREARAAAAIRHPGIVDVFDLGRDGEMAFIVMEKLVGEELTDRIRFGGKLGPRFVAQVGVEAAEALGAAHECGVIHRDVKPQNIFLAERGRDQEVVKLLDFGIAKLAEGDRMEAQLTRTGQIFGTPLYMAPEQAHARRDLDARVDIYAIGAILYEALTARPAFQADSYPSLLLKIVSEEPPSLSELRADVPQDFVAVIVKAMAKNRDDRFPTAHAMADALQRVVDILPADPPPELRRPAPSPGDGANLDETAPRGTPFEPRPRSLASLSPRPSVPSSLTPAPLAPRKPSRLPLVLGGLAVVALGAGLVLWPRPPLEVFLVQPPAEPVDASVEVMVAAPPQPETAKPVVVAPVVGTPPQPVRNGKPQAKKAEPHPEPQPELLPR